MRSAAGRRRKAVRVVGRQDAQHGPDISPSRSAQPGPGVGRLRLRHADGLPILAAHE